MKVGDLAGRLPAGMVSTDPVITATRVGDSWALAMLRRARGDELETPEAVVFPETTQDVAVAITWARQTGTRVIPRGGGTGVCGGAQGAEGSIVLDLSRMDKVTGVDEVSNVVYAQSGVRGGQLEDELEPRGLTVGHYPQSLADSTVGGWIAASSAGQASSGFGAIEDVLLGLTAVLPDGKVLRCPPVPRSAAGPDLRRLLIGSEGTLAVITEAALACRARPPGWRWLARSFSGFDDMAKALRSAVRAATGAVVFRGYDDEDANLSFGSLGHPGGCVALLGFPSDLVALDARMAAAASALGEGQLDEQYGTHWWQHRNDAAKTYAQIMGPERAFGAGTIVDTLEVAGLWSAVPQLYEGIRGALAKHADFTGCHLSHLYRSGSSLYFTFLITASDDQAAQQRYLAAWNEAMASCVSLGGTITHHHGVGRLKPRFLAAELGEAGTGLLAAVKSAVDPAGIMNPGALLP